jgi:hypothetical protein
MAQADLDAEFFATYMLGRLTCGAERDKGRRRHIVFSATWKSACGAKPGRRSVGWADHPDNVRPGDQADCPRCKAAMARKIAREFRP